MSLSKTEPSEEDKRQALIKKNIIVLRTGASIGLLVHNQIIVFHMSRLLMYMYIEFVGERNMRGYFPCSTSR